MLSFDDLAQLGGTPAILLSKGEDLTLDAFRRSVRLTKRRSRAVFDGLQTFTLDPVTHLYPVGREIRYRSHSSLIDHWPLA